MEVGDCSLLHYLIFCEEFISDANKNDFVCRVCEDPVLGHPTFTCLECGFVQHKSCTKLLDLTKMDVEHDITKRHHLLLREEMVNNGKEEAVCLGCGKLVYGPTYRCSVPQCTFHLHKSCHQLSYAIQHIRHPEHTLLLRLPSSTVYCDLCGRYRKKDPLLYACRMCNFDMDIKCLPHWDIIESERKMELGDYSLWHYLIFCEEFVNDDVICWVCEEPVSGHPAFKCLECSFVQHKSCTQLTNLTEMDVKHDIRDRHHLILKEKAENNGKEKVVCVGCGLLTSGPAYGCSIPGCTFHLHKSCHQLSYAIQHIKHPEHTLILGLPRLYYRCRFCFKDRRKETTLLYACHLCNFNMDNKCASRQAITENEIKMEVGDCSIWHYLIFCEKFVDDNYKNNVVCWVCITSVSGHPTFKCLECGFVQHKSCTQLTDLIEMDIKHDIKQRHHLILQKETEDKGKEEVVCVGCGEVAFGPAYRCSIPKCILHLHKSCNQLSHAIQHITHPEHPLVLTLPGLLAWCGFCGKDREKETTLLYRCLPCDFHLDNKCASSLKIIDTKCDQHVFILCRKPIPFKCEACGEATNDIACQCSICGILTHPVCACYPCEIKIRAHHHLVSRTYCLRRVTKLEKAICKLCCKKVNIEYGSYYCEVCEYIVHMKCAKRNEDKSAINSEAIEFEDYTRHLIYLVEGSNMEEDKIVDIPSKIKHSNHPHHELILSFEDSGNDKKCAVCMQFIIFPPFYNCEDCNISIHKGCAQLPKTVRRPPFDKNPFMLSSHLLSSPKPFWQCYICKVIRHGLFYESGDKKIDVQCFLIPETISNKCHEHLLHVPILRDRKLKEICMGCSGKILGWKRYVMCSDCKFWLCFKCATLPLVTRYRYHPHLLKLTYICEDDPGECYCLICEEKLDPQHWFYSCADCDFSAHIQCAIGSSIKSGSHEHPLLLVKAPKSHLECYLCNKSIRGPSSLECTQCKFNFHIKCYY